MPDEFTILGQKVQHPVKQLETFPKPDKVREVILFGDEFTAHCPVTGAPDFYSWKVTYRPDKACVESKSAKLYMWTFFTEGHFIEQLSSIICHDLYEALKPFEIEVEFTMKPRGGIAITSTAAMYRDEED